MTADQPRMNFAEEVKRLAREVSRPPAAQLPAGATDEAAFAFEKRTGLALPPSLREWLEFMNSPCIGPGGLLGIDSPQSWLNIETVLQMYPSWRTNGWIPVAGDGCGNYFILNTSEHGAVYFIDTARDANRLAYAVGSSLWSFLWFMLNRELGVTAGHLWRTSSSATTQKS